MKNIDKILEIYKTKIGQNLGYSDWLIVDQDLINKFASTTFDNQFIHTDINKAKSSPFGSTIAHGFLVLSLSTKFKLEAVPSFEGEKMKINYGFNKLRFTSPVKRDDSIRGVFLLQQISKKSESDLLFNFKLTTEIKGKDKPALVCDWLSLSVY